MKFVMLNLLHSEARELFIDYVSKESSPRSTEIRIKIASCIFLGGLDIHAVSYDEVMLRSPGDEIKHEEVVLIGRGIIHRVSFPWPWMGFVKSMRPSRNREWWVIIKSDQRETLKINLREIFGKAAV
ncbi:MAG: hypothetical protein UV74_C0002G0087 [Candidatus Woesebacteria bacterium GW2011_GWB1_43_14]|uniref:Uncharacterized protein n=1 Tax=Candidatus Woesebacteria bacterium GW2011_GWB1_43_14 TaxID=1618578 RepID=A0A0G1FV41_9BACT|nr:MAG: hypothetical protein UV51_C0004G0036 [Candidatus Woesebacteria bacterium GW2011_GWC1_42_9]KKS98866.1 MAG: hypothetical protein UV74_C0002G0087 [Candidatus Woesebacteria bacterium GW2011_GWB1_43_14]